MAPRSRLSVGRTAQRDKPCGWLVAGEGIIGETLAGRAQKLFGVSVTARPAGEQQRQLGVRDDIFGETLNGLTQQRFGVTLAVGEASEHQC